MSICGCEMVFLRVKWPFPIVPITRVPDHELKVWMTRGWSGTAFAVCHIMRYSLSGSGLSTRVM